MSKEERYLDSDSPNSSSGVFFFSGFLAVNPPKNQTQSEA